jgi:hypothetical protein
MRSYRQMRGRRVSKIECGQLKSGRGQVVLGENSLFCRSEKMLTEGAMQWAETWMKLLWLGKRSTVLMALFWIDYLREMRIMR